MRFKSAAITLISGSGSPVEMPTGGLIQMKSIALPAEMVFTEEKFGPVSELFPT